MPPNVSGHITRTPLKAVAGSTLPYPQHLSDKERVVARHLLDALEAVREIHPDAKLHTVTTFLRVCCEEGKSVKDYADDAGLPTSVMSRSLMELSSRMRTKAPGLDLVSSQQDPEDYRRYRMGITHKGQVLIMRMLKRMQGASNGRDHERVSRKTER